MLWVAGPRASSASAIPSKAAAIAADITEHTVRVKSAVSRISTYQGLGDLDLFDVEYWSLEQAKLGKKKAPPLQGQVAVVTGGTGAIGVGVASVLKNAGAEVVITDIRSVDEVAARLGVTGVEMDVTDEASVARAFDQICARFGGVDIVVPNAGIAVSGLHRVADGRPGARPDGRQLPRRVPGRARGRPHPQAARARVATSS